MLDDKIKQAVKKTFDLVAPKQEINEAYHSSPKPFNQSTEFLSQNLKTAHEQLYHGYIDTLNEVSAKLDAAKEMGSNSSDYRSLKIDETFNMNAVYLHELFFANSFHPESVVYLDNKAYIHLARDYGTFDAWQEDFIKNCMSSHGWAVCGFSFFLKRYVNTFIDQHSLNTLAGIYPVVVVDMFEHAYHQSFLNKKEEYVNVILHELDWEIIEERVEKAEQIAHILK